MLRENNPPPYPFDQEVDFPIAKLIEKPLADGLSEQETRRRALIEFGCGEQIKQTVAKYTPPALAEALLFHLKAALRFIRKSPSFSASSS